MTSLHELQRRFADVLADTDPAALDGLVVRRGIPAAERAAIYRNNVRATFQSTMSVGFPATERLVGADYFRALIDDYRRVHPSRSGNLQHVGAEFEQFIRARFDGSSYSYLSDVVAVEWAYQEVLVAPDHAALDLVRLAAVAPEHYAELRLKLHPAARLLASPFPVVRIWRANRAESLDETPIDLDAGMDRLLLLRRDLDVEIHRLEPGGFAFLDAMGRGATLGDGFDAAIQSSPTADPAALLARYTHLEAIVDFWIEGAEPRAGHAAVAALRPRAEAATS